MIRWPPNAVCSPRRRYGLSLGDLSSRSAGISDGRTEDAWNAGTRDSRMQLWAWASCDRIVHGVLVWCGVLAWRVKEMRLRRPPVLPFFVSKDWLERMNGRRFCRLCLLTLPVAGIFGCSLFDSGDCTSIGTFGILLYVVDSAAQVPPSTTPTLTVTEGSYVEFYAEPNGQGVPGRFAAADEREGTYSLLVKAPGYRDWAKTGVRVIRGGKCNKIVPVTLTAKLQPSA